MLKSTDHRGLNPAKRRVIALIAALTLALLLLVIMLQAPSRLAYAASDLLPDLRMARFDNIRIDEETQAGSKLLRFDSIIVNVGAGRFEARGSRPDTLTPEMTVAQRIYKNGGGHRTRSTPAKMFFDGVNGIHGHNHWHLRDLQRYELIRLDNGSKVGTQAKHGFCFFDNYPFGSTQAAYYKGCGEGQPNALRVTMGLSRGWGDIYDWDLPDQYIDVTGLTSGSYRLRATADASNWFAESNETNNLTWVDIQITGNSVSVIRWGPAAQPISS